MTKQAMIDFINKHYDWFECMQKGLGHDSWWYSNRSPEECINVKLHAWLNIDSLTAKLTEQEMKVIDSLGLDLEEWANDMVWGDWGMVATARESLVDALRDRYNTGHGIAECEYGGRSGGWLAVVYEWDSVPDDYDNPAYTYAEVRKFYQTITKAIAEHDKVKAGVLELKRELEQDIESPENYIDQLREYISSTLDDRQTEAKRILAIPTL